MINNLPENFTEIAPLMEWEIVEPIPPITRLRAVSFDEFRAQVNLKKPVKFQRCLFPDEMILRSASFPEAIEFHECVFIKHLDATDARFRKKLVILGCTLRQSITLESARIDGVLDMRRSTIKLPKGGNKYEFVDTAAYLPPPRFRSAKFAGLHVNGDFKADRLRVYGSLDLGHAEIKGAASFKGAEIGLGKFGGRFYIRQAIVDGDFELEPSVEDDPTLPHDHRTIIHGSLSIGASILMGRLNIRGIMIRGCLHAITVHIKGRVLGDCWKHPTAENGEVRQTTIGTHNSQDKVPTSIFFQDATIDEAIWLHGLITKGSVEFENAKIGGSLELDMWPRDRRTGEKKTYFSDVKANDAGESLILKNARIAANVRLDGAQMEGRIAGHNSRIGAAFLCRPRTYWIKGEGTGNTDVAATTRPVIGCNKLGKSISLYGAHVESNVEISGARLLGGVRMRYAKIGGAVIGQRWKKEEDQVEVDHGVENSTTASIVLDTLIGATHREQSLYLYGTHIGGNLCFEHAELDGYLSAELAHVKGSMILAHSTLCKEHQSEFKEMPVSGAILDKARVDNDVNFQGVICYRQVKAIGCHVLGDFKMSEPDGDNPAWIYRKIDLSGAEIVGDVLLKSVQTKGVNLTDAAVGKLAIDVGKWRSNLRVSLRGIKFHELDVTRSSSPDLPGARGSHSCAPLPAAESLSRRQSKPMRKRAGTFCALLVIQSILMIVISRNWLFYWKMVTGLTMVVSGALVVMILQWFRELRRQLAPLRRVNRKRNPHAELLGLMPRLDLATYSNVEYWLANQGDPWLADEVHYAMRERELRDDEHLPFGRWLWKWLYFLLAGSGTKVHRLLLIHLGIFLISWLCVFSNPGSVEHPATFVIPNFKVTEKVALVAESDGREPDWDESKIYAWADHNGNPNGIPWGVTEVTKTHRFNRIQEAVRQKNGMGPGDPWGPTDGLWVALNVQIPLIHLWARDEWEPASQAGYIGFRGMAWELPFGMQYETFAGLIQVFSYLTIPMVIAAGSRMVKRREPS